MSRPTIMLTAGGTGGHLFPAFALAKELFDRGYSVDIVTDDRGQRFRAEFPGRHVYIVKSASNAGLNPVALYRMVSAIKEGREEALQILHHVQPDLIIGFGGYPTVPPILAGRKLKIRTMIHEANAVMGRANRLLAPLVNAIATSFDDTKFAKGPLLSRKVVVTGNPVRDAVKTWRGRPYHPPAKGHQIFLVVFGGSQGAKFLSDCVPPAIKLIPDEWRELINVVQQCREEDISRVRKYYEQEGISAEVSSFFKNLPDRLASAHLVISRSGAGTVTELMVMGRPSILIPLPHSIDKDQLINATRMAEMGAAWLHEQKDLTPEKLSRILAELLQAPGLLRDAANAAHKAAKPDAVANLSNLAENLIKGHKVARLKKESMK